MDSVNPLILVVDDDAELLVWISMALAGAGYKSHSAASVEIALRLTETIHFNAAVVDLHLPGKSGMEFVQTLRERNMGTPVILMTGQPALDSAIKAIEYGVSAYLVKPFGEAQLATAVERALSKI